MKKIIYSGPSIFTGDYHDPLLENGAVVCNNGIIEDIGDAAAIKMAYPDAIEEKLGQGLITPGLINLHHHLYSAFARGWAPAGEPPQNFPQILERVWWKLDNALNLDDIHFSALIGLSESILSGVTSVVDHHSSQNTISGSLDMIAAAFDKVGLSGSICFELSERAGKEAFERGLKESLSTIDKLNKPDNRLSAMVGLHASMTLSDRALDTISKTTKGLNAGFHFHLAEDRCDQDDSLSKYGMRVAERFAKFGLMNEKSLAIHGVHLDKNEIALLKNHHVNLVLCPRSNQNNAVGFARWWEYDGLSIGLGTDGIGSDVLNEARAALYLSRHISGDPDMGLGNLKDMMLTGNRNIFGKITGLTTGLIKPDYPADMVLWRYNAPTPLTADNIWGHYLYGLSNHRPDSVWAGGRRVLKDGVFAEFDYDEICSRSRILAKSLWERI
jgi:putative selenium metabolism protein SsnA